VNLKKSEVREKYILGLPPRRSGRARRLGVAEELPRSLMLAFKHRGGRGGGDDKMGM